MKKTKKEEQERQIQELIKLNRRLEQKREVNKLKRLGYDKEDIEGILGIKLEQGP